MSEVTRILSAAGDDEAGVAEKLLPLVYDELRKLAAAKMAHEKPGQTLSATALVHEAYLRLTDRETQQHWENRRHFFAAAALAMQRLLIESARRKGRLRRGGNRQRVELECLELPTAGDPEKTLAVAEALERLAHEQPDATEIVRLRYFIGLSIEEAAEILDMSRATAYRHWTFAKAWLQCELDPGD